MRRSSWAGLLLLPLIAVACGSAAASVAPSPPVGAMRVLATSELPGMISVTRVLTPDLLAEDASVPGLAAKIRSWGYIDGRERTFQGQSRHLTLVISRSLIFRDASGASSFVAFVKSNALAYFADFGQALALDAQGRSGWMSSPPGCACHMANPAVVGILASGTGVTWLEINGPDATPALLVNLLDPTLSEPTTLLD